MSNDIYKYLGNPFDLMSIFINTGLGNRYQKTESNSFDICCQKMCIGHGALSRGV